MASAVPHAPAPKTTIFPVNRLLRIRFLDCPYRPIERLQLAKGVEHFGTVKFERLLDVPTEANVDTASLFAQSSI